MFDVPYAYKKFDEAFETYKKALIEELIKEKKLSPLCVGDEVFLVSEPDKLLPRIKKVIVVGIIQDESRVFNFEAKVKPLFSKEEIFVYFKDEDIGIKVFYTIEELCDAKIAKAEELKEFFDD